MFGYDNLTSDRKPPEGFVASLKALDPLLECAWDNSQEVFVILRKRPDHVIYELEMGRAPDPYTVIMECAETYETPILTPDGSRTAIRSIREPGSWVIDKLRRIDRWRPDNNVNDEITKAHDKMESDRRSERANFYEEAEDGMRHAFRKDHNMAQPRVPIAVNGFGG